MTVQGVDGSNEVLRREGEWGLFRLLEDGAVQGRRTEQTFTVAWPLATQAEPVRLEVRLPRRQTPLSPQGGRSNKELLALFRDPALKVPSDVTRRRRGCGS